MEWAVGAAAHLHDSATQQGSSVLREKGDSNKEILCCVREHGKVKKQKRKDGRKLRGRATIVRTASTVYLSFLSLVLLVVVLTYLQQSHRTGTHARGTLNGCPRLAASRVPLMGAAPCIHMLTDHTWT